MAAITWRNIEAPNLGDPSRSLGAAQQSFNGAFSTLGDILKGYQANEAKNWDVTKVNNTEAFLAQAATKFRTPEEFKAALASGELQGLASASGAQIDQATVRNFLDTRLGTLQQRTTTENTFNDQQQELRLRPQLQAVKMLAVNGKTGDVDAALKANPELMSRFGAELVQQGVVSKQALEQFQFAKNRDAEAALKAPLDRAQLEANTKDIAAAAIDRRSNANSSATSAGAAALNAKTNQEQQAFQSGEALQKRLDGLNATKATLGATIGSTTGNSIAIEEIKKNVPTDKLGRVLEAYGKLAADKEFSGLPPGVVVQALAGSIDNSVWIWDNTGDKAKDLLRAAINTPGFQDQLKFQQARLQELNSQTDFLKAQLRGDSPAAQKKTLK